ncbi:MAG: glutamine-hydrolyzing carbamoyl-phosphate synthase small subunit [Kiritimatiellales bacterium]|nr:glutamine-hydrolyzing carbamoyl-phosphate synthase small subunit [Kiritimatiellales bacterium]
MTQLILSDGTTFSGQPFGFLGDSDGEVVFNTGMAGYVESLTDPSYRGQILTFTYPLIGNYGVPSAESNEWPAGRSSQSEGWGFSEHFESEAIHVRGVVVTQQSPDFSHYKAVSSLSNWMEHHKIPGITGIDTRALTKKLREHGVMLGRIVQDGSELRIKNEELRIEDPNLSNLVDEVSVKEVKTYEPNTPHPTPNAPTVAVFDCGIKNDILRSFLKRGVTVHRIPWNFDLEASDLEYDAVFISNGPGDPKMCKETIAQVANSIQKGIPTFGICLGTQILALAVGGDTYKLKYGHRGVNQPCIEHAPTLSPSPTGGGEHSVKPGQKCIITSQNHGFAVDEKSLPADWKVWFTNANDGTVEGIRHESGKFFAVQFHPEATPGPEDANYLFDEFLKVL